MKGYISIFLLLFSFNGISQNRNSVWCFGDSAGIDFSGTAVPIVSGMDSRGSCVTIADTNGNLILYAATMEDYGPYNYYGTKVFNFQNQMIQNADSITGEAWYSEFALFPKPGNDSLYDLFSVGVGPGINQGLFHSIIDMSANGGLGAVVEDNIQLDNSVRSDCLTAIKHGNGRDWWVISKWSTFSTAQQNRFFIYLVTPDTITGPQSQDLGNATDGDFVKIIWHPTESKFMQIIVTGYMAEYNFDRCSGIISLNRIIFPEQTSNYSRIFFDGAYSPNGNLFYVSRNSYGGNYGNNNYLLQYDLTAVNIPLSCDTLDSTLYPMADNGAVRLAPDGKIYYSQAYPHGFPYQDTMRNTINENLGVVNNPDVVGNGCNFAPFSFYLGGKRTYYGLPNNPNYSLGPVLGSPCDTITTVTEPADKTAVVYLNPNPASRIIYFNAQHVRGKSGVLQIVNSLGEKVYEKELPVYNGGYATQAIDISQLPCGIYFLKMQTKRSAE